MAVSPVRINTTSMPFSVTGRIGRINSFVVNVRLYNIAKSPPPLSILTLMLPPLSLLRPRFHRDSSIDILYWFGYILSRDLTLTACMQNRNSAIILLLVMLTCLGCGKSSQKYPVPLGDTRAGSIVMESRPFEIGQDSYDADFGAIRVPENRSVASSRLITIPFLRIHAHAKSPAEPIFGLAGGPGQTNMKWDWGVAGAFLPQHDFVLVGYRGVDGSVVLDCPEVSEAFTAGGDVLGDASLDAIGHAWATSAERLKAGGVDLDGYTMLECIEDNESVRQALGYERINLLGESYGTRVAYLYSLKHSERIFRSALVSVNPPGHFVWEPRTTDAQLKYYSGLWSRDSSMAAKSPDLYAAMRKVLTAMPRRWLFVPINPGKVRVVTFALLFQRKTAAMVFDSYVAAEHGDPSGLALMSVAFDYVVPSLGIWGDLASKAVSADYDSMRDYRADMDPPDLPLGAPMSKLTWGAMGTGRWPAKLLPEEFRKLRPSDVETLLLSGSIDFSTPAEYATKELLPYLKNGKQVVFSECGHVGDVLNANAKNSRLILTSFFDTGVPNTLLNSYIPMDFGVDWGFPAIAKAVLAALVVLAIVFVAVAARLLRRFRRRHRARIISNLAEVTDAK
jgi:pimeloyl-ACP methyl ester carboxylesterase